MLCAPWASEYQYAHRALNFLGRRLAATGRHVLRFDYSGTGDSWGHSTEADLVRWVEDVRQAADELRLASGVERLDLVGLRLGAFVAAQAVKEIPALRRVVLWDPLTDGAKWLREEGGVVGAHEPQVEVSHSLVLPAFVDQVRSIRAEAFDLEAAERVLILLTQPDSYEDCGLSEGERVEKQYMDQPAPWLEDESIWTGQVPVDAVNRIVEWLA